MHFDNNINDDSSGHIIFFYSSSVSVNMIVASILSYFSLDFRNKGFRVATFVVVVLCCLTTIVNLFVDDVLPCFVYVIINLNIVTEALNSSAVFDTEAPVNGSNNDLPFFEISPFTNLKYNLQVLHYLHVTLILFYSSLVYNLLYWTKRC